MKRSATAAFDRLPALAERLRESGPVDRRDVFAIHAPLRICPLGAHVDHQGGVVTGLTVDRSVDLVAVPNESGCFEVSSLDFPGTVVIDLHDGPTQPVGDWGDYARAAVSALAAIHPLGVGLRAVVGGDLPGSGLSSSAAILIAYLMALAHVNGIEHTREGIAALVQASENRFMGVASGRLDQSIILYAEPGHLTRLDCSNFEIRQVPAPERRFRAAFLVAFSGLARSLVRSDFNLRVAECGRAARTLLEIGGRKDAEGAVLSDVEPEVFEARGQALPEMLRRRAAHYFGEAARVEAGVDAWRSGDLDTFGRLMTASGKSSIENYQCGTPETIALWKALVTTPGVLGARFSGAGFGGSCIAMIEVDAAALIIGDVKMKYALAKPVAAAAATYDVCAPSGPAELLKPVV